MTTIVTRAGKGSPLTHTEVDTNFTNLNTNKLETAAIPLGTLAAPSISFVGDANTGAYSPGADTLAFVTAGSNRVHITSGGLVGIGSSAPAGKVMILGADTTTFGTITNGALNLGTVNGTANGRFVNLNFGYDTGATNAPAAIGFTYTSATGNGAGSLYFGTRSVTTDTAPTERLVITSAGLVGIGSTGPLGFLDVKTAADRRLVVQHDTNIQLKAANDSDAPESLRIVADTCIFKTGTTGNGTEAVRIDSSQRLLVGTTNTNPAENNVNGAVFGNDGRLFISTTGNEVIRVNRKTSDGTLIFFHQDGTEEGSISVSGTTVSYNGAHLSRWSQLPSGAEREEILRGSVLSNIDEMCEWGEEDNEQLNRMKVSDVEGDKNVSGVFQDWDDDDDTYTDDFYCAMTGDFIIRIAEGVTVERGDLLMSAGDGTAKPQADDIIRSKTVAKVTSTNVTCTYDDGSYCVPCVLMAC